MPTDELLYQVGKSISRDSSLRESTIPSIRTGLPIRTTVLEKVGIPKRSSENVRRHLAKEAKSWPSFLPPNTLDIHAGITERTLAVLSANLRLSGLDSLVGDPYASLPDAELLWNNGAHLTVIVDEILPEEFREYLKRLSPTKFWKSIVLVSSFPAPQF